MFVKITDPGKGFKTYEEQASAGMELTHLHGPYYLLTSVKPTAAEICGMFGYIEVSQDEVFPPVPEPTLDELKNRKVEYLLAAYQASLFTTVSFKEKVFGNSAIDQKAVDSAATMARDGAYPPEGMHWNTYLGAEKVILLPEEMIGLQLARYIQDKAMFDRYDAKAALAMAATTKEELEEIWWDDPAPEPEPEVTK